MFAKSGSNKSAKVYVPKCARKLGLAESAFVKAYKQLNLIIRSKVKELPKNIFRYIITRPRTVKKKKKLKLSVFL